MDQFLYEHRHEGDVKDWKVIMTENQINLVNDYVASKINEKFKGNPIVIASILKGAIYFTVDLTRRLTIPHSLYFIEASSYKDETQHKLELLSAIIPSKFENRKVILIDELYDNGLTLHLVKTKLLSEVPSLSPEDIFTCVLFKKNKESSYPLPDLVGIDLLPNVWLVGYGLDDNQTKRNWKHLFAVPKTSGSKTIDDGLFDNEDFYNQQLNNIQKYISKL